MKPKTLVLSICLSLIAVWVLLVPPTGSPNSPSLPLDPEEQEQEQVVQQQVGPNDHSEAPFVNPPPSAPSTSSPDPPRPASTTVLSPVNTPLPRPKVDLDVPSGTDAAVAAPDPLSVVKFYEAKVSRMDDAEVKRQLAFASQAVTSASPQQLREKLVKYLSSRKRTIELDPMRNYVRPTQWCSWSGPNVTFRYAPDTTSEAAQNRLKLLEIVENDWSIRRGYLYAFADGAWRHGGMIPHDTDIDIFLILRSNQTRFDFLNEIRPTLPDGYQLLDISRVRHVGEPTAHFYPPSRWTFQQSSE